MYVCVYNQGTMFMISNLVTNERSKHISLRYHMIRDCITEALVRLEYISADMHIADIMAKGWETTKYMQFTKVLLQDAEQIKFSNLVTSPLRGVTQY